MTTNPTNVGDRDRQRRARGMPFRFPRRFLAGGIVSAVAGGVLAIVSGDASAAAAAVVTVDASADLGTYANPAWYHNQTGPKSHLRPGEVARVNALAPRVVRLWVKPAEYYDVATDAYDYDYPNPSGYSVYDYFDQADGYADQLLMNFDVCDAELMTLAAPEKCREALKNGLAAYKQRYPALRYVEVFNESDKVWTPGPGEAPALSIDDYYQWYKIAYGVVNEVNAELDPAVRIQVGGPVPYTFDSAYLKGFLDRFAADTDPAKRMDFIAYHEYGRKANPADVKTAKSTIALWLRNRGLPATTPVFVTEYGVFPGANTGTTFAEDVLTQASAMATLGMFYVEGGMDMPMRWAFNHPSNDRKSMMVDAVDGAVYPYYHVSTMESMLKARRIRSISSAQSAAGIGVNALATRDGTGLAVLATNYQWTTGTESYSTTVDIRNLPAEFAGRQISIERYLVDATTSNYAADPANSDLQAVERYVLPAGSVVAPTFTLGRNAVSLLVVTPVVYGEAESQATTASGGREADISDTLANAGLLNKFTAAGVGGQVTYAVSVDRAGTYDLVARLKKAPDRGIVRVAVDGVALGDPLDTSASGYPFVYLDLGTRALTAGTHAISFTMVGTSSGGFTLGVDSLQWEQRDPLRYEVEDLVPRSPSGDQLYYLTEAGASAGKLIKAATGEAGDSVRFTVSVPRPGRYVLSAQVRSYNTRGMCQFNVAGATVGGAQDLYSAGVVYTTLAVGTVTVPAAGNLTIGCTVTGRNPASTGFDLAFDYLQLDPTP